MDPREIANIRLKNQQLVSTDFKTPKQLIEWMGAMQAQDYNQAKWAIGVRMPHLKEMQIEDAFNKGEILRTHLMRPTWHFVSADDIYWMLELTSPQIKSVLNSRHRELGITELLVNNSYMAMEDAINSSEHQAMTRDELIEQLVHAGIPTSHQLTAHIMLRAEIDGIICSGPLKGKKQTYALLSKRVPHKITLTKEEALAKLCRKYFLSHGPATISDFIWWSALPAQSARRALESIKHDFNSFRLATETYWFSGYSEPDRKPADSVLLLPAYDEFLISYKDRSASITAENHKRAISSNGIFRPVVLVNGQISGLWKKTLKKDQIVIETEYFKPHHTANNLLIREAVNLFGDFAEKKAVLQLG